MKAVEIFEIRGNICNALSLLFLLTTVSVVPRIFDIEDTMTSHAKLHNRLQTDMVLPSASSSGMWWMIMWESRKSRYDSLDRAPRTWFALAFTVPCTLRMGRIQLLEKHRELWNLIELSQKIDSWVEW